MFKSFLIKNITCLESFCTLQPSLLTSMAGRMHFKCRNSVYPRCEEVKRFHVPDDKVLWSVSYPEYNPVVFTDPKVQAAPVWADRDLLNQDEKNRPPPLKFNEVDGKISRESFTGKYSLSEDGLPLNPVGRTGIRGRASLGRWGPNHAADPIVTRWKRDDAGEVVKDMTSGKPILQFVSVQRRDTGDWAIPGGMVDPGESISITLKREFGEEALATIEATPEKRKRLQELVSEQLSHGTEVFKGYVDDPRNTDNSWMETQAYNFHDDTGNGIGSVKLTAGDDAQAVRWMDISSSLQLYASHKDFIHAVAKLRCAHW